MRIHGKASDKSPRPVELWPKGSKIKHRHQKLEIMSISYALAAAAADVVHLNSPSSCKFSKKLRHMRIQESILRRSELNVGNKWIEVL